MARKTKEEAEKTRKEIIESARRVFHLEGVSRSTCEKIAQAAGVTRGAVYWHFKDKADVFFAMRADVFVPLIERTDSILFSEQFDNPLDAIEGSLKEFFRVLDDCPVVREVFDIMMSRCEYVGEFASVQEEVARPAYEYLAKIERVYRRASELGYLRQDLQPDVMARDTWAFTSGLLHLMLGGQPGPGLEEQIPGMISAHMAMRRKA